MKKVIGIIGGMGPMATADLYMKIISRTKAASDREHIHVLIDGDTDIPDRTAAIIGGGESPVDELKRAAKRLEGAGAQLLMMPCNTAHYFYDKVAESASVPVLNMLELTADTLVRNGIKRAGLLATDGTVKTGIYERLFASRGIECIKPSAEGQKAVMSLIYDGVKAGREDFDISAVKAELSDMEKRGAQTFVLGCTELPLAFKSYAIPGNTTDPTMVLAEAAVTSAGYELK